MEVGNQRTAAATGAVLLAVNGAADAITDPDPVAGCPRCRPRVATPWPNGRLVAGRAGSVEGWATGRAPRTPGGRGRTPARRPGGRAAVPEIRS
ncbi:hypothetical protein ACL02O_29670 [Micromonospora sp. MS34]|uniref:hypothetical protein n=1 Tax=Micromonospora sp. MS34 TaxID=3385971 RepID=UPI0039A3B004